MSVFKKIEYSLKYNRTGKLNRNGSALVQIRAYQNGVSRYFSTEVWIEPQFWDKKQKRVKSSHPNSHALNKRIRDKKGQLEGFEARMINRHGFFPIQRLHEYQDECIQNLSFSQFFESELNNATIKHGSLKNQRTTFNKLIAFQRIIYFEDISYSLVVSFDRYLRRQGLGLNTINKHHRNLGKYVRLAIAKGLLDVNANPYKRFKAQSVEPNRVFLTIEELEQIRQLQIPDDEKYLGRIRDFFLAGCWTGLRFGDLNALTPLNFIKKEDGLHISLKAIKTEKSLTLPLRLLFRSPDQEKSYPEILFSGYLQARKSMPKEMDCIPIFGGITNQYFNRSLKVIAKKVGIHKKLSSHVCRRTFASILATKVEMPVLQKLLQHSTLDMVKVYVRLSNKQIVNELGKIKW